MKSDTIRKIFFTGDYPPRMCGIATFTQDLVAAVRENAPDISCDVAAVTDIPGSYQYPEEVRFEIQERDIQSYRQAADYINASGADLVCLQHEFGIYGGTDGEYIVSFLENLRIPVFTTLHTVLENPSPEQRRVILAIERYSFSLIVMSETGKRILASTFGIPHKKIRVIPHGIPDMPFVDTAFYKDHFSVDGRRVLLTFGLLSPNKGLEYMIRALPDVIRVHPDVVYIILGATHPNLVRRDGEAYRGTLRKLSYDLGVNGAVIFRNRFVSMSELLEYLGAADIYITPYLNPEQITSGTLSYAFGCGKAVVSTPYRHAEELLADGRGVLVPFRDSVSLSRELVSLLSDDQRRNTMRKRAYMAGREMTWQSAGRMYIALFREYNPIVVFPNQREIPLFSGEPEYPSIDFTYLERLTDSTGLFQHAKYSFPNLQHGYCTDDNARALRLAVLLEEIEPGTPAEDLIPVYAAFVNHAFDESRKLFRNFMSFDRRWLDETGSWDCRGRALHALGTIVRSSGAGDLSLWAARLFQEVLGPFVSASHPRSMAYGLLGITEYLSRFGGDRAARTAGILFAERLAEMVRTNSRNDWKWFESRLTYANAVLPHALIEAGLVFAKSSYMDIGLSTLEWIVKAQTSEGGYFRPIGSNSFPMRNGEYSHFDQQPIEAYTTVEACISAFRASGESRWLTEAHKAFEWFLGKNDLGIPLIDPVTGGCFDGLTSDGVNLNQGAESLLSWLGSLLSMRSVADLPVIHPGYGNSKSEKSAELTDSDGDGPYENITSKDPAV